MRKKKKSFTISWLAINKGSFLLLLALAGCDLFQFKSSKEEEDSIVAEVGEQKLRKSELYFLNTQGQSAEDSTNLTQADVQSWIRKQLMVKEASKNPVFDESEINRKVLDYKYALIVYEFEKSYVDANLDNTFKEEEIVSYYEANKANFALKEVIVKAFYVQMEKSSNQNAAIERLLKNPEGKEKQLRELVKKAANNYFLEDSTWVKFESIAQNTPLALEPNRVQLLRNKKVIVTEDDRYRHYFRILEYKLQDQIPPLEFVRDEISKILLNKRRIALTEQLQKEIYNRALENNDFKIYE